MTRRDYVKFAGLISRHATRKSKAEKDLVRDVAKGMADIFSEDNPRFNVDRFYKACGIETQ